MLRALDVEVHNNDNENNRIIIIIIIIIVIIIMRIISLSLYIYIYIYIGVYIYIHRCIYIYIYIYLYTHIIHNNHNKIIIRDTLRAEVDVPDHGHSKAGPAQSIIAIMFNCLLPLLYDYYYYC